MLKYWVEKLWDDAEPIAEPDREKNAVLREVRCWLESNVAGRLAQPFGER